MRHTTSFVSSNYLLYPESSKLGRIVLNPQEPLEAYFDLYPDPGQLKDNGGDIHVTPGIDLSFTFNEARKKSLRGALLQLFSGNLSSIIAGHESLEGETKRYILGNAEHLFRKACAGEEAREWLQENVIKPKVDAYMIVGYHTITNPRIVNGNQLQRETRFRADDALVGTAAPGLPGIAQVRNATWNQRRYMQKLSVDGEGIFAVQYRKVVYKLDRWYSDSQVGLRDSKWHMYLHVRGQDDQGHYSVETDLGDPAEFEPEPADSDDEDEPVPPPEFYFVKTGDVGEDGEGGEVEEEFIFIHEVHAPPEEEDEENEE